MEVSDVFLWNYAPEKFCNKSAKDIKIIVNQGGTGSGKTYAILQVLFAIAVETPQRVITVVGQDVPNLKSGAIRDAKSIVASDVNLQSYIKSYNSTDRIYTFNNDSIIEFKSYSDDQDAKSGKRDFLFINEANGIPYEVYFELNIRTKERTYIDYNPNAEFWVHSKVLPEKNAIRFISNYKHNTFLTKTIIDKIEELQVSDPEMYRIYGLGKTGNIQGLVFPKCKITSQFPEDCKKVAYGLDFGFSNDVTALVKTGELSGNLYGQELIYEAGLLNRDISNYMKALGIPKSSIIYADQAEPKSIADLRQMGWNVVSCEKGKDSILAGINKINSYSNFYIVGSNWIKESQKYVWKKHNGQALNQPIDMFNHCFDAARYSLSFRQKIGKATVSTF